MKKKIVICVFLVICGAGLWSWRQYDHQFTPERWAQTGISQRGKLVDSLLEQYNGLEGMTRAEVEALLGADTDGMQVWETLRPDGASEKIPMLVYAAGRPGAFFPEYLYILLENDRVIEAKVIAD